MADTTEISWTDSTFNPWQGCARVGQGCDHCYAEALDRRVGGGIHWGVGAPRKMQSADYWRRPLRWQKKAAETGIRRKVFCGSMCDWADKETPDGQRERLWDLIRSTPDLDWQLLTKRASNIKKYLPPDWGSGYHNVWLGVTVENRRQGLRRMEMLREIPARIRFLSLEPLLEDLGDIDLSSVHWVIVGGESGSKARSMETAWVENVRRQCLEQGVPFFFKQWGGRVGKGGCELLGLEVKNWPVGW